MKALSLTLLTAALLCPVALLDAQATNNDDGMENCPMHKEYTANSHHRVVEKHGDKEMGFSHRTTGHHFRMSADGGAIEVTANDPKDRTDTAAIRSHLSHIAVMFADGDFSSPMFVHDGVPPGVTTMNLLKAKIRYTYEEIASGGRIRIEATDPLALAAIHDFLRFQITEHRTGDTLAIESAR